MKTLTRLGSAVSVELEDGSTVDLAGSMLYDPDGQAWPKCSLLIMSFTRSGIEPEDVPKFAKVWHGDYKIREGRATIPPRDLDEWREGPKVRILFYTHSGEIEEEESGYLKHPFNEWGGRLGRIIPWRFGEPPVLYRRAGASRLELHSGCAIDASMGILSP